MAKTEPFIGLKNGWSPITENYATEMDNNLKTLGFFSKRVVESRSVSNPTTITPANGKAWIIGASPTGVWAGKQNQIAAYIESAWVYYVPTDGLNLYVSAENGFFVYKSTPTAGWVAVSTGGSGGSGGSGTINAGENLGAGKKVYAQVSGDKIQMRTIVAGDNVTLTETATEIKIDAVSSSQSGLSSAENIGTGEGVYAQVSGDKIQMKTLVAGDNIELTSSEDEITFKVLSSGGIQDGENLGAGKQVYAQVSGDKIQLRTLVAGNNVTLTETATEIKIDSASAPQDGIKDGVNKALPSPDNHNIFLAKSSDKLEFSSLKAGTNTTITSDQTNGVVTINSTQPNVDSFVVNGENTGDGTALFKAKVDKNLQIKTIKSGAGISITSDENTVTVSSTGGSGTINTGENLGTGKKVYAQVVGDKIQMRTLVAGDNVTLTETTNEIKIDAVFSGGLGAINSGENLGTGEGVYAQVVGDKIQMKTLVAGDNVSLTSSADEIIIESTSVGGIQDGYNKASLSPDNHNIFLSKNGDKLEFSSLTAGENTTITSNPTNGTVTINSTQPNVDGFIVDAENIGSGYQLVKEKVDKKIQIKTINAGTGISIANDLDTLTINSTGGGSLPDNVITGGLNDHQSEADPSSGNPIIGILKNQLFDPDKNTLVFKGISAGTGIIIEDVIDPETSGEYGLLRISAEPPLIVSGYVSAAGSYTLKPEDAGKCMECSSASPTTIIVPANTFYSNGTMIYICQVGTGTVTIQAGAGLTIRSPAGLTIAGQYHHVSLRFSSNKICYLTGGLTT